MSFKLNEIFEKVDSSKDIKITNISIEKYSLNIDLTNVFKANNSELNYIQKLFGVPGIRGEQIENGLAFRLSIPRIEVPEQAYKVSELLKALTDSYGKDWILGISDFGPEKVDMSSFTHGYVIGASGYGKSSYFRFLLMQTLAFHPEVINYIVDPKQVDFELYDDHPNVMKRASTFTEWMNLFYALMIEIEVRKFYFSNAFEKPPVKLDEYLSLRKEYGRDDLPAFKKMIIWIDEAHILFQGMHSDLNAPGVLAHLIRQARAFGIHFMFSSQKYNDVNSTVRSQIPCYFYFYTPISEGGVMDHIDRDKVKCIRGRLGVKYGDKTIHNLQAPFVEDMESVAASYLLNKSRIELGPEFKDGFFRIHIDESAFEKLSILNDILKGEGLESFMSKEVTVKEESRSWGGGGNPKVEIDYIKELYSLENTSVTSNHSHPSAKDHLSLECRKAVYDIWLEVRDELTKNDEEQTKEALKEKYTLVYSKIKTDAKLNNLESTLICFKLKESLLIRIGKDESEIRKEILEYATSEATSKDSKNSEEVNEAIAVQNTVSIVRPEKTKNKLVIESLLSKYSKIYDQESFKEDLKWCTRDLSRNSIVNICYKRMLKQNKSLDIFNDTAQINFDELALTEVNKRLAKKYISEITKIKSSDESGPLLVLYGENGMGKRTLLEAIAAQLEMPLRESNKDDLLADIENSELSRELALSEPRDEELGVKSRVNSKDEIVIFTDIDMALTFVKKPKGNIHPVLFIDLSPSESFFEKRMGSSSIKEKVRYLSQYNIFIQLQFSDYMEQENLNKLIKALLKKYHYVFKEDDNSCNYGEMFAKHRVELLPKKIDSIIERSHYRAKNIGKEFDLASLQEILTDFEIAQNLGSHKAVDVILPSKSLDDLIITNENRSDLKNAITFSKSIQDENFEFIKKIRKSDRLVMLLCGPPGTGKTMSAEVIATELSKELWVCSIARMQSAYVGESEKIIESIFKSAQVAGAVLLIDECDAFLKTRDQLGQNHEQKLLNHLLMLVENFKGVLVLTTNYADKLDSAFSRRIDLKLFMDFPDEKGKVEILKLLLLPDAPLAEDVDLEKATKGLRLSGGLIKNAVERSYMLMVGEDKQYITHKMLRDSLEAVTRENELVSNKMKKISL